MRANVLIVVLLGSLLVTKGDTFDVKEFGARGNGSTLDRNAINDTIRAACAKGGGQVLFRAGRYLTGTIELKSNVTLFLEAGAVIEGTTNLTEYIPFRPPAGTPESKFKPDWHRALILGVDVENVTIAGSGVIDGKKVFDPKGEERMRGPHTILFGHSRNAVIRDVRIRDAANYAVMLEDSSDVEVRGVRIWGGWDGVHFRGWPDRYCRNISITGCEFYTGDDSIAGRYWENVVIRNCILNSSCNGIRLIGPARHLIIDDCLFYGPGLQPHRSSNRTNMLAAIALQPGAWDATEGVLDDVLISGITAHDVTTPFYIVAKGKNPIGRVTIERSSATGAYRAPVSVESWSGAPITNVTFRNVTMEFTGGAMETDANTVIKSPGVDARKLPVWGIYGRNVLNLVFENVRLGTDKSDARPAVIVENVERVRFDEFKYPKRQGGDSIVFKDVKQVEEQP